jgi:hypothetical protein
MHNDFPINPAVNLTEHQLSYFVEPISDFARFIAQGSVYKKTAIQAAVYVPEKTAILNI